MTFPNVVTEIKGYLDKVLEVREISRKFIVRPFIITFKSSKGVDQYRRIDAVGGAVQQLDILKTGDMLNIHVELKGRYTKEDAEKPVTVLNSDICFKIIKL